MVIILHFFLSSEVDDLSYPEDFLTSLNQTLPSPFLTRICNFQKSYTEAHPDLVFYRLIYLCFKGGIRKEQGIYKRLYTHNSKGFSNKEKLTTDETSKRGL